MIRIAVRIMHFSGDSLLWRSSGNCPLRPNIGIEFAKHESCLAGASPKKVGLERDSHLGLWGLCIVRDVCFFWLLGLSVRSAPATNNDKTSGGSWLGTKTIHKHQQEPAAAIGSISLAGLQSKLSNASQ